ncbi:hypothetical protein PM082_004464 [Marasmius tenuissimus]|nr:hypothetical protein PM082_004464 [Marasmius tenuissimus]
MGHREREGGFWNSQSIQDCSPVSIPYPVGVGVLDVVPQCSVQQDPVLVVYWSYEHHVMLLIAKSRAYCVLNFLLQEHAAPLQHNGM